MCLAKVLSAQRLSKHRLRLLVARSFKRLQVLLTNSSLKKLQIVFALKEEEVWILELIETGQSIFYTDKAGTRKSAVIKALKDRMGNSKEIYFTAPTGSVA